MTCDNCIWKMKKKINLNYWNFYWNILRPKSLKLNQNYYLYLYRPAQIYGWLIIKYGLNFSIKNIFYIKLNLNLNIFKII